MASKALLVLKHFKRVVKFRGPRINHIIKEAPFIPKPVFRHEVVQAQPRHTIWKMTRFLFRAPQLFRRGPFSPIRLGFCIGLAINYSNTQEFREIKDVANTCLQSSISQGKDWNLTNFSSLHQLETGPFLNKGCQGAIYAARSADALTLRACEEAESEEWPLVMKMLFNYRRENQRGSPADEEIAESFRAETLPLSFLPPHPSIAKVHGVVVEEVPELPEAAAEFPSALPASMFPNLPDICFGEEKTLFLIMRRYSSSLYERLTEGALTEEESLHVLLQLLEGDVFLKKHGIAHRDLHAKNILLDEEKGLLKACITDFGCATDRLTPHSRHFLGLDTPPGIPALQAPEVADLEADGTLDYRKADLWTIATLVYEMFAPGSNPFTKGHGLDSRFYADSDIPPVDGAPRWLNSLVQEMLRRDPGDRPTSEFCADIIHLMLLQLPLRWLVAEEEPSWAELSQWLALKVAALVMSHRQNHLAFFHLVFCRRLTEPTFRQCVRWLRQNLA